VNPTDFLPIAERYYKSNSEAERRTCIGRCYYVLYNQLVAALTSKGVQFEKEGNHGRLVHYLASCSPRAAPTIGEDLKILRLYRNYADYDMKQSIDLKRTEFVFKKADTAIRQVKALQPSEIEKIAQCIRFLPPYKAFRKQNR
jgi:hypothetical protein